MRLFIAFPLLEKIKTILGRCMETIKYCGVKASFVRAQNLHLTIKFLGEVEPRGLESIKAAMGNTARGFSAVNVRLTDWGFFPHERRPKIFFIATDNETRLGIIARTLEKNLEKSGFVRENRFKPHITLARIKNPENIEKLAKKIEILKPRDEFTIGEIVLFKSILSAQRPTYEEIFSQPLTGKIP
jgi:2'-5' RNA ligase